MRLAGSAAVTRATAVRDGIARAFRGLCRPDGTSRRATAVRRMAAVALLLTVATSGVQAQEQAPVTENTDGTVTVVLVTENADGTVTVVLEDRHFLISAVVAEDVAAAVRDLADDPQALEQALASIVALHAGDADDAEQAAAIAAFAILHTVGRSASVDAIVRGALVGNRNIPAGTLLAAITVAGLDRRERTDAERQLAELQATLEDSRQISPVE